MDFEEELYLSHPKINGGNLIRVKYLTTQNIDVLDDDDTIVLSYGNLVAPFIMSLLRFLARNYSHIPDGEISFKIAIIKMISEYNDR